MSSAPIRIIILLSGVVVSAAAAAFVAVAISLLLPSWNQDIVMIGGLMFMCALHVALVFCLPAALMSGRRNMRRWWWCPLIGAVASLIFVVLVRVDILCVPCGALGGMAFWPFWLWTERLKVGDHSIARSLK